MEKEYKIGSECTVDLSIANGFVSITENYVGTDMKESLTVSVSADVLLDKLAEKLGNGAAAKGAAAVLKSAIRLV